MEFRLYSNIKNIFILGAGASSDYGLPVWKELGPKITEKLNNNEENKFKYKKQILKWVEKVGDKKLYATIDECISKESISADHHNDGVDVESELFNIMKEIFNESYVETREKWISKLNEKILKSNSDLHKQIAFINCNYDHVLDDNLLSFEYLTQKQHLIHNIRLSSLLNASFPALYPHGRMFSDQELRRRSFLFKNFDTIKTGNNGLLDVVSCHDTKMHLVTDYYTATPRNLYILGLGGGLEVNLNNLIFDFPIMEIHVTIKNLDLKDTIIKFLSKKFNIAPTEIAIYKSCDDLIEKNFN